VYGFFIINTFFHLDYSSRSTGASAGPTARTHLRSACVVGGPARVGLRGSIAQHQDEGLRAYDKPTE